MTILSNASTLGSIAFGLKKEVRTGVMATGFRLGDLDGDGKPDLVLLQGNGNAFVAVKNTSSLTVPAITSFDPQAARVGETVRLRGRHFGQSVAGNTVYFGAVRATVTSASESLLVVTVPSGATHAPVSVTVGRLTGYSRQAFVPMFSNSGRIDSAAFVLAARIGQTVGVRHVAVADIDADGKPDLLAASYGRPSASSYGNVGVFRNNSSPGSFTFADPVTIGYHPVFVTTSDLDGDGMLDLVNLQSSYYNEMLSLWRNSSIPGACAFSLQGSAGVFLPKNATIVDANGDGKPDIAVGCSNGPAFLLRNMAIGDSLMIEAGNKIDSTQSEGTWVSSGDVDADGREDLVTSNRSLSSVFTFRNTGLLGFVSFAPRVVLPAGIGGPVALADIDGNDKADLVVAGSGEVVILRNRSTSGNVVFTKEATCAGSVGPCGIAISDLNGDGKPDVVVANDTGKCLTILPNTSTAGTPQFGPSVFLHVGTRVSSVAIADFDGDGGPDLAVAEPDSDRVSIYRNATVVTRIAQQEEIPTEFSLSQNYPIPFNPRTQIRFQIPEPRHVRLAVYDLLGREVGVLVNERMQPGKYSATFDGSGLASGVYFYRVMATGDNGSSFTRTNRMILMK